MTHTENMPQITELSLQEMQRTNGGDWIELAWGILHGGTMAAAVGFRPVCLGLAGTVHWSSPHWIDLVL